jgi:hypothetical protein
MKRRSIADRRNFSALIQDAERQLTRGLLTPAEYREIESNIKPLWSGETVETITEAVKEQFKKYGTHTEEHGIGWILKYY